MQETGVWSLAQEDPHTTEQLRPCATNPEPRTLESEHRNAEPRAPGPGNRNAEPRAPGPGNRNLWSMHTLQPLLCNREATAMKTCALQPERSPHVPQLEKKPCSNEDSAQPKINKY